MLVVDDEPLIRWWLSQSLTDHGYGVGEAEDGRTALRLLAEDTRLPDVVLLDYRLPDSEGFELLSNIVSRVPEGRVILMTAYSVPDGTQGALARGAFAVLNKPFEIHDVLALVDSPQPTRSSV